MVTVMVIIGKQKGGRYIYDNDMNKQSSSSSSSSSSRHRTTFLILHPFVIEVVICNIVQ